MAQMEKLIERVLSNPIDFTWEELVRLLSHFGYAELKKGRSGGSGRKFADSSGHIIYLHKPHPANVLKPYAIKYVIAELIKKGKL
jgi:hypothetical protein